METKRSFVMTQWNLKLMVGAPEFFSQLAHIAFAVISEQMA